MKPVQTGCCAVCRRTEAGIGYSPPGRKTAFKVTWVCEACVEFAKAVHTMKNDSLNRIEREALDAAGDKAGDYLDGLGKTDLAQLTPEEWQAFLDTILDQFGAEMRTRLGAHMAPF